MENYEIDKRLVKLSIDIFNAEGDCGFMIIKKDGKYVNILINYLNPYLLVKIYEDGFIIKNVNTYTINNKLAVSVEFNID